MREGDGDHIAGVLQSRAWYQGHPDALGHELNHDVQVAGLRDDARGEAGFAVHGLQDRPQAALAGERHDRLVTYSAEWYRPARREWVTGVGRQHRRLAGHQDRLHAGWRFLA